jgi:hypothetical protein
VIPLELGQRLDQADRVPTVFPCAFIDMVPPRMHGGEQALLEPPRFAEDSSGRGGAGAEAEASKSLQPDRWNYQSLPEQAPEP